MRICRDLFLVFPSIFCLFLTESCQLGIRGSKQELGAGCTGSGALRPPLVQGDDFRQHALNLPDSGCTEVSWRRRAQRC